MDDRPGAAGQARYVNLHRRMSSGKASIKSMVLHNVQKYANFLSIYVVKVNYPKASLIFSPWRLGTTQAPPLRMVFEFYLMFGLHNDRT